MALSIRSTRLHRGAYRHLAAMARRKANMGLGSGCSGCSFRCGIYRAPRYDFLASLAGRGSPAVDRSIEPPCRVWDVISIWRRFLLGRAGSFISRRPVTVCQTVLNPLICNRGKITRFAEISDSFNGGDRFPNLGVTRSNRVGVTNKINSLRNPVGSLCLWGSIGVPNLQNFSVELLLPTTRSASFLRD
jgi:hypothetical protein